MHVHWPGRWLPRRSRSHRAHRHDVGVARPDANTHIVIHHHHQRTHVHVHSSHVHAGHFTHGTCRWTRRRHRHVHVHLLLRGSLRIWRSRWHLHAGHIHLHLVRRRLRCRGSFGRRRLRRHVHARHIAHLFLVCRIFCRYFLLS